MRVLVIDCQILQTAAYDRGMGKYTISLLRALLQKNQQQKVYQKITLLFSSQLDITPSRIKAITDALPGADDTRLSLPIDIADKLHEKYAQAEATVTDYVASIANAEVDFLITSPFFAAFPAVFPKGNIARKFSIVYDLIPYKIWHLQRIFDDEIYARHFKLFLEADHLFTISNAVKTDLIELIDIPAKKITSIDGGPFAQPKSVTKTTLKKPYVLFPSAPIVHKNNLKAVYAFAVFNSGHQGKFRLYITSTFDDDTKKQLTDISKEVVFTGNISDSELAAAYDGASAVLFPSLTEGLGMPVLEAVMHNVPVACSNIPVLSELSATGFYMFDPNSVPHMASALSQAVERVDWDQKTAEYRKVKKIFTWDRSANILLKSLGNKTPVRKKPTETLQLSFPRPNHDTAAGALGELLFAEADERFETGLEFTAGGVLDRPSYVAYLSQRKLGKSRRLQITTQRTPLSFVRRDVAKVTVAIEPTSSKITFLARRVLVDKALHLKGWQFSSRSGRSLSAADIFDNLFKQQGNS